MITLPSETVGLVEILDMAVNPFGVSATVIAQQRKVAGALLGHQIVTVGQNQQTSWIHKTSGKRRRRETRRHLWHLPGVGDDQRPIGHDWSGLRCRQIGWVDLETPTYLMLD